MSERDFDVGDELTLRGRVLRRLDDGRVRLSLTLEHDGRLAAAGEGEVRPEAGRPLAAGALFARLIAAAAREGPVPAAVVRPEEPRALEGALAAAEAGLIRPVLIGVPARIAAAAEAAGLDLGGLEVVGADSDASAAALGAAFVRDGRCRLLMKGHLHTDTFLKAVMDKAAGLRGARRLSHAFVLDPHGVDRLLILSDAAINIAPDVSAKLDITQNAVDLARALGVARPRAAILSAVETVNPAMPSTVDAALLAKMAERGQITGGVVDGPLAMDNALDPAAASAKGLTSPVAGRADVLIAPDIESGNLTAKQLVFVGRAESAGVVLGAAAPIVLTSRADDARARVASCAVAIGFDRWRRTGEPLIDGSGEA